MAWRLGSMRQKENSPESNTQRVEAFSDGVFAIAITLLILEIKVPRLHGGNGGANLHTALLHLWPSYFAYVFSFVMIGIYWANHHYIFRLYARTNHYFDLLNVFFLMCISFLPFPTAALAEYINDARNQQNAVAFYALGLLLPALAWWFLWLYARRAGLLDENLDDAFVRFLDRQYWVSIALYSVAFVISLWNAIVALTVCIGLTGLYALPPKTPVYRK